MTLHNLPTHLTPFVGRETDITEIGDLLCEEDCRLLSLIGPGGMGKTRLAIEIAEQKTDDFIEGVFFVALQSLVSADSIVSTIAASLNFEFYDEEENLEEQLLYYLSSKEMLLLLDNFEHVLEAAELVANILACAPKIKILTTSREALKLQQEWIRPVKGMSFPDDVRVSEISSYSAVQLFIERAQQFRRNFQVADELPHIIRICQLVGGMPLGIELAVAWLKTLSCAEIAIEIERNFDLLTAQMRDIAERHQSIHVVFASTWHMLTEDEQVTFMRLSVFRGTPTRQAIQSVTGASLLALYGLADKALLVPTENGRYHIHELLRQYAYEKLEESPERETIQNTHSQYYLRFMQERDADLHGCRQIEAINEIDVDFENVRAAWEWAVEQMNQDGIASAVEALCTYLHFRSRWKQDSQMITDAENRFAPKPNEEPGLIWAMLAARNYMQQDDSVAILEKAIQVAREHNAKAEIGLYLLLTGYAHIRYSNFQESLRYSNSQAALRYFEASLPYFEEVKDTYHLGRAYNDIAGTHRRLGNYDLCLQFNEKSLALSRAIGDIDGQTFATDELASVMFVIGNLDKAEQNRYETVLLSQQIGSSWLLAMQKWELATYHQFAIKGDVEAARQLILEVDLLRGSVEYKGMFISTALSKSLFALVDENYDEVLVYGEEAAKQGEDDAWFPLYCWGLMIAATGRGDYDTVRVYNKALLSEFWNLRVVPILFVGIAFSAILAAYDDKNPRRATELLALAMTHRSSMFGWLKIWAFIDRLQQHLENELGTSAYQAAWERGQILEWQSIVPDLLADYEYDSVSNGNGSIPYTVLEANAELFEPLSERELEVLLKIGAGFTNKEIADELFVGVSTVKKHITHIYSKLQVESRTQALLRAQEINLM